MSELRDPRVFFAAERTALAWNRTALTLMAFGFAIERFGLFMRMLLEKSASPERDAAFWFGLAFIVLGCIFSFFAALQYKTTLRTLHPAEVPSHVNPHLAFALNIIIGAMAAGLTLYLIFSKHM